MSENILILYEEEIYANGLELLLKEINNELNVTKHIIYSDVEEILESEQFSMVIVPKEKTISVQHICQKIKDINKCCKIVFMGTSFTIDDIRRYVDYDVNDSVQILNGPFKDSIGTVKEINKEKHKVKVLVSMFGRETPVELEFSQVQKVN